MKPDGKREKSIFNFNGYVILFENKTENKTLVTNLNRAITLHLESGLESFHSSFAKFLSEIKLEVASAEREKDDDQPKLLRLDQLSLFLVVFSIQILIAIGAFIAEIIVHRNRSRRLNQVPDV